jgi:hypothetical protein
MIDEAVGPKNDFYIKLTNEAAMPTVLSAFYNEEGEFVSNTPDYAIDVIGTLYDATGVTLTDANGMDYPEMTALPGWHVNIRLSGEALRASVEAIDVLYGVTPAAARRVWL